MEAANQLWPLSSSQPAYDAVIVGTGVAGLYTALKLPKTMKILMISKDAVDKSNSTLAQGGICVLKDPSDFEVYYQDTLKAGHYKNRPESVEIMIKSSPRVIADLISYGVEFEQDRHGNYVYTREGAHTVPRILHYQDCTGKEITRKLIRRAEEAANITLQPYRKMVDILYKNNTCKGVVMEDQNGVSQVISCRHTVLATGGIGGLFENSTNYPHIAGDSFALAIKYHIKLENLNYIQIHPTAFCDKDNQRRFLISEAVRGEGGTLLNHKGERFVNELLPRDVVTQAICAELQDSGEDHVYLSICHLPQEHIRRRFPNIYRHCLEKGYDLTREPIPVTPAQHYIMGGIRTGVNGETSCSNLYAVGETACNGVHGANRLASNSLLESLVFAERTAKKIAALPRAEYEPYHMERHLFRVKGKDREGQFRTYIMNEIRRKDEEFYAKWCDNGVKRR